MKLIFNGLFLLTTTFVYTSDLEQASTKKIQQTYRKHRQERLEKQRNSPYIIRKVKKSDIDALVDFYKTVAADENSHLARTPHEITREYIEKMVNNATEKGLGFVADLHGEIVGVMIKLKSDLERFSHVLSDGNIAMHPKYQGKGIGRQLIQRLLQEVKQNRPEIMRVEMIANESNKVGLGLYESEGFIPEGRFVKKFHDRKTGKYQDDIPLAWTRP